MNPAGTLLAGMHDDATEALALLGDARESLDELILGYLRRAGGDMPSEDYWKVSLALHHVRERLKNIAAATAGHEVRQ